MTPPPVRAEGVRLRRAAGRTTAQKRWLERQLNDPYVASAKRDGYRSRAAYKLLELDERFHLLRRGQKIVDLGAAPGGWSQVAAARGALVAGIDLLPVEPLEGASFIQGDFAADDMPDRLAAILGGPADLVLSDMAPNATGHAATDHLRTLALAERAVEFALANTAPGGALVAKVFQGGSERGLLETLRRSYARVRHAKPPASRRESPELYVVATGFRGS